MNANIFKSNWNGKDGYVVYFDNGGEYFNTGGADMVRYRADGSAVSEGAAEFLGLPRLSESQMANALPSGHPLLVEFEQDASDRSDARAIANELRWNDRELNF